VAVYSEADADLPYVHEADAAVAIGPAPVAQSYLNVAAVLGAAHAAGADAVHPGYGLLSENADFAAAVLKAGLRFIGPAPATIARMGSKIEARKAAVAAGVPVAPGSGGLADVQAALAAAQAIGYPVMLKASAGGGGIGMVTVADDDTLRTAFSASAERARQYFADGALYVEKYVQAPRHVEVQVLGDEHGRVVALGERECSIQRRHQKIVEESPSTAVSPELRTRLQEAALNLARGLGYVGAGTVEFMLDDAGNFYFLEVNTRLQVEHPVTEAVMGVDIVQWQLHIADGAALPAELECVRPRGHAIECRVCAEDPDRLLPAPGNVTRLVLPTGDGVRNECGIAQGNRITPHYDPMFAKLITWGETREAARERMVRALRAYEVEGVKTNLALLSRIVQHAAFVSGATHTDFLTKELGFPEGITR
jgi:acetyl-CoA carboxylase biotin carboxylase subunit